MPGLTKPITEGSNMADTTLSTTASRRAILGGAVAAPALLALGTTPAIANVSDALIERAFQRRQNAYATYNALPVENGPVVNGYGPRERELWGVIDASEHIIRTATATTPRGVMLQLWCAMYHSVSGQEDDAALTRGDFAAIDSLDNSLDWNARLMLAALRSLQSMEA